ncbi:MAG: hypothetical protein GY870_04735, partial [archaeon]|nr:hypothetical protein [archaeon]
MSDNLDRIASKYGKDIETALLTAFDSLRTQYTVKELTETLNAQGAYGVMQLFSDMDDNIAAAIVPEINDAINQSGKVSIELIPKGAVEGPISFNMLNEHTTEYIRA